MSLIPRRPRGVVPFAAQSGLSMAAGRPKGNSDARQRLITAAGCPCAGCAGEVGRLG